MSRAQLAGAAILCAVVLAALLAPVLEPNDPATQYRNLAYAPPMPPRLVRDGALSRPFVYPLRLTNRLERQFSEDRGQPVAIRFFADGRVLSTAGHPWLLLGADPLGRDVFARLLAGSRRSLGVAGMAVLMTLGLGTLAGAAAGYLGGTTDRVITGIADFVIVLPVLYVVLTLRAAMPLTLESATVFWTMAGVLAAASWPLPARGVRSIVAVERTKAYAESAYALGAGPWRILLRHVLPASFGHVAIQGLLLFPAFIFAEATLSYLGLGFAEPLSSWGAMLQDAGRVSAMVEAPWLLAPAGAIVLTVTGVHLTLGAGRLSRGNGYARGVSRQVFTAGTSART